MFSTWQIAVNNLATPKYELWLQLKVTVFTSQHNAQVIELRGATRMVKTPKSHLQVEH